jgi:hypothetical protein
LSNLFQAQARPSGYGLQVFILGSYVYDLSPEETHLDTHGAPVCVDLSKLSIQYPTLLWLNPKTESSRLPEYELYQALLIFHQTE